MAGRRLVIASLLLGLIFAAAGCGRAGTVAHHRLDAGANGSAAVAATVMVEQPAGSLDQPLRRYATYVDQTLSRLRPQLLQLRREIAARTLPGARRAWLAAHLTWLELGQDDGAYGAFGTLGNQIDGTAAGVIGGSSSPRFTGFHRIELDLWRHHSLAQAGPAAARLAQLVGSLTPAAVAAALPATTSAINAWALRAHEILEDALRDSLSEHDDYGSNTDLASVTADVSATREMLRVLGPSIERRSPGLVSTAERELSAIDRVIAGTHRGATSWREPGALPVRDRQDLDAAVGAALETLAPISELMQVGPA